MKTRFLFAGLLAAFSMQAQTVSDVIPYSGAIITYTVPACVTNVTIEARGASGGNNGSSPVQPGSGATMTGDFAVTPGMQLKILVGQNNNAGNGGGGGTFVTDMSNNPWIVAGGGGGGAEGMDSPMKDGQTTTSGGNGAGGGGNGGTAGSGGFIGASFASGAGGGLNSNGQDGWAAGSGGFAFINGGAGGNVGFGIGGFGGGGNGSGYVVGGGGGGYSGGGSGSNSMGQGGVGGGGGSFNAGTNQVNSSGTNTGDGMVIITYTLGPQAPSTITGSNNICLGSTILLVADSVSGVTSYNWTVGDSAFIVSGQGNDSVMVNVGSMSDVVSVTVTGPCGTSTPTTFTYTVNPLPVVTVTAISPVCEGTSVTMTAAGATNYTWSSGGTDTTETITAMSTATYTVTGTDANGCSSTATQQISVNMNPVVFLGNDTTVCGSLILDGQNAGASYMWTDSSSTQMITVNNSGSYGVTVTDANGCSSTDNINVSVGGNFTVTASAAMTFLCTGEPTVMLTGSPAGGTWTGAGVFGSTFEADTAGAGTHDILYTYTDSLGCSGMDTVSITVDLCLGIADAGAEFINVYPNPNSGAFFLSTGTDVALLQVTVTDLNGRTVYVSQAQNVSPQNNMLVDMSNESAGVYFMQINADGNISTTKIIISK